MAKHKTHPHKIRRMSVEDQAAAWALYYTNGASSEVIAKQLGFSGPAIRMFLKRKGGTIRGACEAHRTKAINEQAFDVLTPESSYWLGVLMTDGCIQDPEADSSPCLSITWHMDDKAHLEAFDTFMGGGGRVREKVRKDGRVYADWGARSVKIADTLKTYGIVPRKTKSACPPDSLKNNRDFWRGCWDGDGEVDEGNNCPALSLIGSFPLVQAFCDYFGKICPEYPLNPRPTKHTSCTAYINLYGHGAMVLLRTIYEGATVAMPRKMEKAVRMLEKYKDKNFRILKTDIHQRTTFPYVYTDMLKATEDFGKLKALNPATLVQTLVKGDVSAVETAIITKSRVGMYASHFFHEEVRMNARGRGKQSPMRVWADEVMRQKIIDEAENRKHSNIRASMSANCQPCWGFMPAVAKAVYQHFGAKRILDPCAGWGDRLTAALSLSDLERYDGYDPNNAMNDVYQRIMNCYGGRQRASVETIPFEDAAVAQGVYDIAFTSPPYFDYEEYSDDEDQSYKRYPDAEMWRSSFLQPLMQKCTEGVKAGGVVAINISDAGKAPLVNWLIHASEGCPSLRFIGTLFVQTGNFDRAHEGIYCWRKI